MSLNEMLKTQSLAEEESAVADVPNETVDLSNGHDLSAEKQQLQAARTSAAGAQQQFFAETAGVPLS